MQFHHVLVSASPGDAITSAALEIRDLLREVGPSNLYARFWAPELEDDVLPLAELGRSQSTRPRDDVVIFHASIGEPEVAAFVAGRPERLIVMYHNISPWERFLPFDPRFAGLLAAGRLELAALAEKTELALTVSHYNAAELAKVGFRTIAVAPLVVDVERLKGVEPHVGVTNHFEQMVDGPVVLFVGQLLPHKRPDLLIEAYNIVATYLVPNAHLIMVGAPRLERYAYFLKHQIQELNLSRAWLTGAVSLGELAAFYRGASLFVTMSEHEGFCVPLLEAMGFDIPVIARDCTAIPETVGDAGILLPNDNAVLAAEAMAEVLTSPSLQADLVERGRRRLTGYDPDVARALLLNHILSVATS